MAQAPAGPMQRDIDAMLPGQWLEIVENAAGTIKGTRISRVFPPREGHPGWGNMGPRAAVDAWSGGAFDTKRELLIVSGGGHRDYGGNEVYAFSMRSLEWKRLTDPSRLERDHSRTVDGTPISRHTYDGLEYLPDLDRIILVGGAPYDVGGGGDLNVWLFDTDRRTWLRKAIAPQMTHPATAYDLRTSRFYVRIYSSLFVYELATDHWTPLARHPFLSHGTMEFDPENHRLVTVADGKAWFYDLRPKGPVLLQAIPADGAGADPVRHDGLGLAYDPKGRVITAWAGGRAVWALEALSLRWKIISAAEGPAPDKNADSFGIYGRWRYVPSRDVFIGLPSAGRNVWLFKPLRESR